jgi:hypothetical protein
MEVTRAALNLKIQEALSLQELREKALPSAPAPMRPASLDRLEGMLVLPFFPGKQ